MPELNNDQLQAVNEALNKHLAIDNLSDFINNLQEVYFEYTRFLVRDTDSIHTDCEVYLFDLAAIINILQKGLNHH